MREPAKDKGRLEHIIESINNIFEFVGNKTSAQIIEDKMCYYAIVYHLVIIGEAANMLTADFRDEHPLTSWREIIAMRNFIVHGYNMVDKNEVVSVIENDLVILKNDIQSYIDEINTENNNR